MKEGLYLIYFIIVIVFIVSLIIYQNKKTKKKKYKPINTINIYPHHSFLWYGLLVHIIININILDRYMTEEPYTDSIFYTLLILCIISTSILIYKGMGKSVQLKDHALYISFYGQKQNTIMIKDIDYILVTFYFMKLYKDDKLLCKIKKNDKNCEAFRNYMTEDNVDIVNPLSTRRYKSPKEVIRSLSLSGNRIKLEDTDELLKIEKENFHLGLYKYRELVIGLEFCLHNNVKGKKRYQLMDAKIYDFEQDFILSSVDSEILYDIKRHIYREWAYPWDLKSVKWLHIDKKYGLLPKWGISRYKEIKNVTVKGKKPDNVMEIQTLKGMGYFWMYYDVGNMWQISDNDIAMG